MPGASGTNKNVLRIAKDIPEAISIAYYFIPFFSGERGATGGGIVLLVVFTKDVVEASFIISVIGNPCFLGRAGAELLFRSYIPPKNIVEAS